MCLLSNWNSLIKQYVAMHNVEEGYPKGFVCVSILPKSCRGVVNERLPWCPRDYMWLAYMVMGRKRRSRQSSTCPKACGESKSNCPGRLTIKPPEATGLSLKPPESDVTLDPFPASLMWHSHLFPWASSIFVDSEQKGITKKGIFL